MTPAGEDGLGTAGTPAVGRYVVTTDQQRREWGLPDLANGAADYAPGEPDALESPGAVPVVESAEALDLLFEDGPSRSLAAPLMNGAAGEGVAADIGGRRCGRPLPAAAVVNLKRNLGPIPESVRAAFGELSGQPRIDGLLRSLDEFIEPLDQSFVPGFEVAAGEVAALRRQEVTAERLGEAGGADSADERSERVALTCWTIERRLRLPGKVVALLDFSAMQITPSPSSFQELLRRVEEDPAGNTPEAGLVSAFGGALRGFERAAGQAVSRIRALVAARRGVASGEWSYAALGRVRQVLERLEEVREVLDCDTLPSDELEAVRESLKKEEDQAADPRAAATRDVLGRLEAADLPVEVLARALDEVRQAQTVSREAAAVALERLRLVAALPWTARAAERVDIEAAMAELDAAHAGRPEIKARIHRFLATRRLTSAAWTVEGQQRPPAGRTPGRASGPVALRRLVVRSPRPAARAPILCFAGPPGAGKTSLARRIGEALGRPAVVVPLGGVWDETAIRGLSITYRTPSVGQVVSALLEAKVRNPVIILDELDKVGGRTPSHGDPSAALLEVLDPEQNTRFRDAYLDVGFDLSEVLFIATANDLAGVPAPLRDRLEVIASPGYTEEEKVDIVRRNLWAEQLEAAGLAGGGFWTRHGAETHRGRQEETSGAGGVRPAGGGGGARRRAGGGAGRDDGCVGPGSRPGPHLRGGGAAARAAARRHLPDRGEPPGGDRRHHAVDRRRRRRRGRASRPRPSPRHGGGAAGTAAVRLAARPRAGRAVA